MATERPPLELHAEVVYPDGTTARWDADAREAKDVPTGITFKTQRYNGFADAQLTLNRRIDVDYPDLGLLDGLNLVGHDGSVAYEGWIGAMPRSLQSGPQIAVQVPGWMSHAKDEPFVEIYVDRDLSKWQGPGTPLQVKEIINNYSPSSGSVGPDSAGTPSLVQQCTGAWAAEGRPFVSNWYHAPGINVGAVYYAWTKGEKVNAADTNWVWKVQILEDDALAVVVDSGSLRAAGPGTGTLTSTAGSWAALIYRYNAAGGTANVPYAVYWSKLAVYGAHGLERRGEDPGGFYVSDMMADIAQRFAPKLDTSGIKQTTFVVPHASFLSDTLPYDAWQTLNAYHRWEMAVYENRKLLYWPIDLEDWDWEVRLSDPGTTVSLQGDDSAHLCNGVIVSYTDLNTGYATRLSPDDFSDLKDESPDNPANLAGRKLYTPMSISVPTMQAGAIQMGRMFLAEFNQAQSPGSITITGHIRDRAGHWQQGWKVRASDRLIISDLPNDSVRVVGETEWNHDSKTLTIAVDSSFKRLDAILSRLGVALESSNLSLP